MAYKISLPVFEGPFDLLLHLVKINEMEIGDIDVARITDEYLNAIKAMEELDLDVAGDFLVMAATLINLKVRALLPELPDENAEDDGEEISDIMSAKQLMDQLIEYRKFKELSIDLSQRQEEQMRLYYRNSLLPALREAQDEGPLSSELGLLFDCFSRVLGYVESLPHHDVAFEPFSVEQRVGVLREAIRSHKTLELFALFRKCRNKPDMIVTFLALLELSRLKEIRLEQGEPHQEVYVYPRPQSGSIEDAPHFDGNSGRAGPAAAVARERSAE